MNGSSKIIKFLGVIILLVLLGGFAAVKGGVIKPQIADLPIMPMMTNDEGENTEKEKPTATDNNYSALIGPLDIADMVEKVSTAIVNIETKTTTSIQDQYWLDDPFFRQFFGDNMLRPREYVQNGIGTGFIVDASGLIITNQHVIEKATEITVNISEGKRYPAEIVGQDFDLDLAILKIDAEEDLTVLPLGDSDKIRVGEWVVAIGNPYGLDHTVTAGVISYKGRPIKIENRSYKNLIQTDAAINPGNSGGPLLTIYGEAIGINTAVNYGAQGIGFAISINTVKEVLDELITKGKVVRPYIGADLQEVDNNMAQFLKVEPQGLVVIDVIKDSPGEKAGLKIYDVITALDNTSLNNYDHLLELLSERQIGDEITLDLIRDEVPMSIKVTLEEKP